MAAKCWYFVFIFCYLAESHSIPQKVLKVLNRAEQNAITTQPYNYEEYQKLATIEAELFRYQEHHPDLVKVHRFGFTYERRQLSIIQIGLEPHKPSNFIECGIHAREWISPATCMWLIRELITGDRTLLKRFNFHILPVMNPDGYEFTFGPSFAHRSWRKNRVPTSTIFNHDTCKGVDLNRNFAAGWTKNTVHNECTGTYQGKHPESEPEVYETCNYLRELSNRTTISSYISFHNFKQLWMTPYGYTDRKSKDYEYQMNLARLATETIRKTSGKVYTPGTVNSLYGKAVGGSIDWVYDTLKVKASFGVELRPHNGSVHSFYLPANQIKPTGIEIWAALNAVYSNL